MIVAVYKQQIIHAQFLEYLVLLNASVESNHPASMKLSFSNYQLIF